MSTGPNRHTGAAWVFPFQIIRVWQLSAQELLAGPLALLPLAPIANLEEDEVPTVLAEVARRVITEAEPHLTDTLRAAIGNLLELRYGAMTTEQLLREADETGRTNWLTLLRDGWEAKGAIEHSHRLILNMGREKFGESSPEVEEKIRSLRDVDQLDSLAIAVLRSTSWDDLLRG